MSPRPKPSPFPTSCSLDCGDRCSLRCLVADGAVVGLSGELDHPFTRGYTCRKIHRYPGRLNHGDRVVTPWIRTDGTFRAADWGDALDFAASRLESCLGDPDSVAYLRGTGSQGQSKTYLDYLFGGLGAGSVTGSLCDDAGIAAVVRDAGALRMNHPSEIDRAKAIVLWGKHPRACSIHTARQVASARRRGVPVIGVNPDAGEVGDLCTSVVPVRPGSDRYLALAVVKLLADDGHVPGLEKVANSDAFMGLLSGLSLEELLLHCDVSRANVELLRSTYEKHPEVATICGWGLQRYDHGAETVRAIHAVAIAAGTVGVEGGGFYYNVPSGRHLRPLERMKPLTAPTPTGSHRRSAVSLPRFGASLREAEPAVRFMWVSAGNPLNQAPGADAAREAFRAVETTVVVDAFWTETARQADVVLPPALWLEEEDLAGSYWFPVVGAIRKIIEPRAGCRSDFEILKDLESRLGVVSPYDDIEGWLTDRLPDEAPPLEEIRRAGWWVPDEDSVAWRNGSAHDDRRFWLLAELSNPDPPGSDRDHRPRLLSLIRREALHSQMLPEEQTAPLTARMHPSRAASAGLEDGQTVILESRTGCMTVRLALDSLLHPDAVACPRDGWIEFGLSPNVLTEARVTDDGETAAFYETRVSVLPADTEAGTWKQRSSRPLSS